MAPKVVSSLATALTGGLYFELPEKNGNGRDHRDSSSHVHGINVIRLYIWCTLFVVPVSLSLSFIGDTDPMPRVSEGPNSTSSIVVAQDSSHGAKKDVIQIVCTASVGIIFLIVLTLNVSLHAAFDQNADPDEVVDEPELGSTGSGQSEGPDSESIPELSPATTKLSESPEDSGIADAEIATQGDSESIPELSPATRSAEAPEDTGIADAEIATPGYSESIPELSPAVRSAEGPEDTGIADAEIATQDDPESTPEPVPAERSAEAPEDTGAADAEIATQDDPESTPEPVPAARSAETPEDTGAANAEMAVPASESEGLEANNDARRESGAPSSSEVSEHLLSVGETAAPNAETRFDLSRQSASPVERDPNEKSRQEKITLLKNDMDAQCREKQLAVLKMIIEHKNCHTQAAREMFKRGEERISRTHQVAACALRKIILRVFKNDELGQYDEMLISRACKDLAKTRIIILNHHYLARGTELLEGGDIALIHQNALLLGESEMAAAHVIEHVIERVIGGIGEGTAQEHAQRVGSDEVADNVGVTMASASGAALPLSNESEVLGDSGGAESEEDGEPDGGAHEEVASQNRALANGDGEPDDRAPEEVASQNRALANGDGEPDDRAPEEVASQNRALANGDGEPDD